ncbi:hypothetical protein ACFSM5_22075 [Lacibacterium aquatile]|uniref:DUF4105 domain-containing protein n=1 Tax=Lacibacterium aquatile TaxID=1168082 RepID=A0ABW5DWU6_9PROT
MRRQAYASGRNSHKLISENEIGGSLPTQTPKRRVPPEAKPLIWAGALAAGYLFGLHPFSGPFGGIAFFFLGWLIPTTVQILSAFGIAYLFPGGLYRRSLIFVAALIAVIVLPSAGRLIEWARSDPVVEMAVAGDGQVLSKPPGDIRTSLVIYDSPWLSRWTFGGNEACGCLYFETSDASNYLHHLDNLIFKSGLRDRFGSASARKNLPQGLLLIEHVEEDGASRFNLVLSVYRNDGLIGVFRHKHLPKSLIVQKPGLSWKNLHEDFLNRAGDMLLRASLLNNMLARIGPTYFPERELTEFIRKTMLAS